MEQPNNNGQASHIRCVFQSQRQKNAHLKDMASNSLSSVELIILLMTNKLKVENYGKLNLLENSIGLLAGGAECYDLFSDRFDPVICEIHNIDQII